MENRIDSAISTMLMRCPELEEIVPDLHAAYEILSHTFENDGTLYLCGNGGSLSDALHISGEMLKAYTLPRPLDGEQQHKLAAAGPDGPQLAQALQQGLRAVVLGLNHSLHSAVENDIALPGAGYAQELSVLGHPGDALLAISTSGNSTNVCYAAQVARAKGMTTIALTGTCDETRHNKLAALADIGLCVPETATDRIQELHVQVYHCLCEMLEISFFGARKKK